MYRSKDSELKEIYIRVEKLSDELINDFRDIISITEELDKLNKNVYEE